MGNAAWKCQCIETHAPTTAWADNFGVWHVRVPRSFASPRHLAYVRLVDELEQRGAIDRSRLTTVRVKDLDDETSLVFAEHWPGETPGITY